MNLVYLITFIVLFVCLSGGLCRVIFASDNSNRMLASQLFGTVGVTLVILLAFLMEVDFLINLSLILTLLASITVIAFLKLAEQAQADSSSQQE